MLRAAYRRPAAGVASRIWQGVASPDAQPRHAHPLHEALAPLLCRDPASGRALSSAALPPIHSLQDPPRLCTTPCSDHSSRAPALGSSAGRPSPGALLAPQWLLRRSLVPRPHTSHLVTPNPELLAPPPSSASAASCPRLGSPPTGPTGSTEWRWSRPMGRRHLSSEAEAASSSPPAEHPADPPLAGNTEPLPQEAHDPPPSAEAPQEPSFPGSESSSAEEAEAGGAAEDAMEMRSVGELQMQMRDLFNAGNFKGVNALFLRWMNSPLALEEGGVPPVATWNLLLKSMVRGDPLLGRRDTQRVPPPGGEGESFRPRGRSAVLGRMEEAVSLMKRRGVEPDAETYHMLTHTALRQHNAAMAVEIMNEMQKVGLVPEAACFNLLISVSSSNRRMSQAMRQMQTMIRLGHRPSRSALVDLLLGCARTRRTRDCVAVIREMQVRGVEVSASALGEVVNSCAEADDPECAVAALQLMRPLGAGVAPLLDLGTALLALQTAARTGHPPLLNKVWSILSEPGASPPLPACHLARVHTLAAVRDFRGAVQALWEYESMLAHAPVLDLPPDSEAAPMSPEQHRLELLNPFTSLGPLTLSLSHSVDALDTVYFMLEHQAKRGVDVPRSALNCIIAGCSTLRDEHRAVLTFEEMQSSLQLAPDANTYAALISAYGNTHQGEKAEATFQRMKSAGITPSRQAHLARFEAHIMTMNAPGALVALNDLVEGGTIPNRAMLVQLYRRSERAGFTAGVHRARELLQEHGYRDPNTADMPRRIQLFEVADQCIAR